jgi:hypothetical protein
MLQVKRIAVLALLVGAVSLVGFGCGVSSVKSSDLVGIYTAKYGHGSEKLTLSADGTFSQVYTQLEDRQSTTNSGTWKFEKEHGDICLTDAYRFDEYGRRSKQPFEKAMRLIRVAVRLGQISLVYGERGVEEYQRERGQTTTLPRPVSRGAPLNASTAQMRRRKDRTGVSPGRPRSSPLSLTPAPARTLPR